MSDSEIHDADRLSPEEVNKRADEMLVILDEISDPLERDETKNMLMGVHEVDPDTRLQVRLENDGQFVAEGEPPADDTARAEEEKAEAEPEPAKDEKAEPDELAALREQLAARDRQIAELQGKVSVVNSEENLTETADKAVEEMARNIELKEAEYEKKVQEHRDYYGDEPADALKNTYDELVKVQKEAMESKWQSVYDNAKKELEQQNAGYSRLMDDIRDIPELKEWMRMAQEENRPHMWGMAEQMDLILQQDDNWKGKPDKERFAEVARRVKIASGAQSGTPAPDNDKTTEQKIAEVIGDDVRPKPAPESLSDLPGGVENNELNSLADISMSKLSTLSLSDLDKIGEQLE